MSLPYRVKQKCAFYVNGNLFISLNTITNNQFIITTLTTLQHLQYLHDLNVPWNELIFLPISDIFINWLYFFVLPLFIIVVSCQIWIWICNFFVICIYSIFVLLFSGVI